MSKNKDFIEVNLHDKFHKETTLSVNLSLGELMQISNTIMFVLNNKQKFLKEANDCKSCFEKLEENYEIIEDLIDLAHKYQK